jgi:hypothetical protein
MTSITPLAVIRRKARENRPTSVRINYLSFVFDFESIGALREI